MQMNTGSNFRALALAIALPSILLLGACSEQESASVASGMSAKIERFDEGRNFYGVISIPAGAETLYLSGAGARPKADGSWGSMEEQAVDIFTTFKGTLEGMGWS